MAEQKKNQSRKSNDIKNRTAIAALGMNTLLTAVKFLLFFFSGSMAILAEAWHSFTDIVTSFLVLIAVRHSGRNGSTKQKDGESENDFGTASSYAAGRMELAVSFCIGLILLLVSAFLIKKSITSEIIQIRNPLFSGLIFLLFSLGSYFVYKLEVKVGKSEGSIGLVADGMHARADMTSSLLTGFSLILYTLGLNIDRWVAGLIAFFILSFALETIVNTGMAFFHRKSDRLFRYRSFTLIAFLFDRIALQKAVKAIQNFLVSRVGDSIKIRLFLKTVLFLPLILIIAAYVSTAFYTVGSREKAIVERFGIPLKLRKPIDPGLHLKLPWPIDSVEKTNVAFIHELSIGNITDRKAFALLWTRQHGTEEAFLSGDNNLFYPYIVLHYRIKNVAAYLYENIDPVKLLNEVGHRVATYLFVKEKFYDIAAVHRKRLEQELLQGLQENLDKMKSGIEILSVNFKDIHPPIAVADSFEKVIAGHQEKQKIINEARGYKNRTLPKSRGEAAETFETAKSYMVDRTQHAEGSAARFVMTLPVSKKEKQLTRSRLYLQTMQTALKEKTKIIVDPKSGIPEIWMGFKKFSVMDFEGGIQE